MTYWAFATFLSIGFVLKHNTYTHIHVIADRWQIQRPDCGARLLVDY